MPEFQLQSQQSTLFNLSFEETRIEGSGGYHAPHLRIPLGFRCSQQRPDIVLVPYEVAAWLYLGPRSDDLSRADDLLSFALQIDRPQAGYCFEIGLAMPLSAHLIEQIEEARNGKDLYLSLSLRCNVGVESTAGNGLRTIYLASGSITFGIPRSHWIDRILPRMGYGSKYLLEVEVLASTDLKIEFQKALQELKDAERAFQADNYDGVLMNCRNAINAIASAFHLNLVLVFGAKCITQDMTPSIVRGVGRDACPSPFDPTEHPAPGRS